MYFSVADPKPIDSVKRVWDEVKNYVFASTDQAERKVVLGTLGASNDAKMKLQTLESSISEEVKLQDFFYLMGSVDHSSSWY